MKKRKRGRPRMVEAKRYPNGEVVHRPIEEREQDARQIATEARQRVFELSVAHSSRIEATSPLGRLLLSGIITQEQFNASEEYVVVVKRYEKAILIRRPGSAGDLDRTHGFDGDDGTDERYVEQCNAARRAYSEARRALLEADPLAQMAVNTWAIEHIEADKMIGELRVGLNALARLYVREWKKAS